MCAFPLNARDRALGTGGSSRWRRRRGLPAATGRAFARRLHLLHRHVARWSLYCTAVHSHAWGHHCVLTRFTDITQVISRGCHTECLP